MPSHDTLIARIALSLWTSSRKVERLPRVTEVQPWEVCDIVPMPPECRKLIAFGLSIHEGI